MCLIVDASAVGTLLAQPSAVRVWLAGTRGSPRLVADGKLRKEMAHLNEVKRLLVELERAGKLRPVAPARLQEEEARLRAKAVCRSNDHHVLALGIVSGARTLATSDHDLAADFRNRLIINKPRGRIYRDPAKHAHLLGHTPRSCGVSSR